MKKTNSAKAKAGKAKTGSIGNIVSRVARKAVNSKPAREMLGEIRMNKCAAKLAYAIADPFSENARGACFPLYPAPDSHKVTAFSRVEGAIGTLGIGFIAINPSVANNAPSYYVTGSTCTQGRAGILSAASTLSTGWTAGYHNGPYTAEQFIRNDAVAEPELAGRVVAVGIRVTYTGTTLNESGLCVSLCHPTHGNLAGVTPNQLQLFSQADICPFTRKPCTSIVAPAGINETSYPGPTESTNLRLLYPFGPDGRFHSAYESPTAPSYVNNITVDGVAVSTGAPIHVVAVSGVAGSTFHVDIIYHLEYTGSDTASMATPNSVDVSSVYAILTAAAQLSTRKMADPNGSNWKLLMDGIRAAMGSPVALTARGVIL